MLQGYREDDGLYTQSDTDEQLLIHIAFNTATRLSGLVIKSADDTGKAPKFIKLFVNHPTIGFSEASDSAGLETFELNDGNLSGEPIPLKPVKFSRVNVLTIFIESNRGDEDTTIIHKICILGESGQKFDVSQIKDITKEDM